MIYRLDNISLSALGAYNGRGNGYYALDGMLDLPRRIGKTEHDWGTSIEPFVQAEDIQLDGRTLTLTAIVKRDKRDAYVAACIACKTLSFDYDSFDVVCRDEIKVDDVGAHCTVTTRFWQNNFTLKPTTISPSSSGALRLDNFDLNKDFGIYIAQSNNLSNTAKRIDVNTTEFYTQTKYRGARSISLHCSMLGNGFADLYSKMNGFEAAVMAAGVRRIAIGDEQFTVYFKDGITVNILYSNILKFTLKAAIL